MSNDTSRARRFAGASLIVGVLLLPLRLSGQVQWTAQLGAAWSSALVTDAIIDPIKVEPRIAPDLFLSASIPSDDKGRRVGLEAALTSGSYISKEDGASTPLGTLRTATIALDVTGPLARDLRWRGALGIISYLPADKTGIFQDGAPTRALGGVGLEYRRDFRPGWTLVGALRWDYHRFTTAHLQSQGYTGSQDVHRVSLTLGVVR
jgi:hypothetical protein